MFPCLVKFLKLKQTAASEKSQRSAVVCSRRQVKKSKKKEKKVIKKNSIKMLETKTLSSKCYVNVFK